MKISAVSSINIVNSKFVRKNKTSEPTFTAQKIKLPTSSLTINFPEIEKLRQLQISNYRIVDRTNMSGSTFADKTEKLKGLKDFGIKTIIDFRGEAGSFFAQECKKNKIKYYNFNLNNVQNLTNPEYFIHKKNEKFQITDKFVDKLLEFFKLVNKGKAYIGCQYGIDRTNMGLTLNYLMNPEADFPPRILTWPYEKKKQIANKNIKAVKKIIKHLSPEQKQKLNITEDYSLVLKEKIYNLLVRNNLLQNMPTI